MEIRFSKAKILLYLKVFVVDLLYVSVGCVLTWPSPMVGRLNLTSTQASLVGSLMALGAAFGPLLTTWSQARLGRKPALMGAGGTFLISWVVLAASEDFAVICAGRIIGGVAMGVAFIGIPVYLTEISDVKERQAVTTFTEFFLGIGYLIVYLGGPRLSYEANQAVCATVTLCFLAGFTMMPESPVFLVSRGQNEIALKVLTDLRKSPQVAQQELTEIEKYLEEEKAKEKAKESIVSLLSQPGYMKALLVSMFALVFQQASGVIVMVCYLEPILDKLSHLSLDRNIAAMIIGSGNLPSLILSPPMARYLGTKKTLVICSTVMALSVIAFTVYEDFEIRGYDLTGFDWLPVLVLFLYNVFFCTGLGPLTWCVVAEISPPKIKGFVCFVSSTVCWLIAFILLIVFQPVFYSIGPTAVFGFFSACLVIGTVLVQIALPNTKGLTLQEIQDKIAGVKNISKDKRQTQISRL